MTMVRYIVQGKVVPLCRCQRIDDQSVVGLFDQTHQPGDDQITVTRMQVVFAVIVSVVTFERPGIRMQSFGQVGPSIFAMRPRVDFQHFLIVGRRDR